MKVTATNPAGGIKNNTGAVALPAACLSVILLVSLAAMPVSGADGSSPEAAWVKTYPSCGSCEGHAVSTLEGGGFIVTGTVQKSQSGQALFALRTDSAGNEQWRIAGSGSCGGNAAVPAGTGRLAVAGRGCSAASGAATLTILDEGKGTVMTGWDYDGGRNAAATALLRTKNGGYLLLADADTGIAGRTDRDFIIHRILPDGTLAWSRAFSMPLNDTGASALEAADGSFVIAATTETGGDGGEDIVVLSLDSSGNELWTKTIGRNDNERAAGIVLADGGGYIVAGTACSREKDFNCDFYAAGITADGRVLWDKRYGGTGREYAAAILPAPGGGYTIAGSTDSADLGSGGRDIRVVQIAESGVETGNITFGTSAYETVTGAALAPGGSLIITGYSAAPTGTGPRTLYLINAGRGGMAPPAELLNTAPPGSTGITTVNVRDARTGNGIADAFVYIDGSLACRTSSDSGSCTPGKRAGGTHSCRVVKDGYKETTVRFSGSDAYLTISLQPSPIHKLAGAGTPEQSLDIIFVPSATSYDCTVQQKIPDDRYTKSPDAFLADVRRLITNRLLSLDKYTSVPGLIPTDYRERLNIWYYWDGYTFADAFNGCAGTLPDSFYDDAPYADVAIILYPEYRGTDTTGTCEPVGCTSGPGPGPQVYFKVAADRGVIFLHESGHAMFGLMDTYCGNTYYEENGPNANIWGSNASCRDYAQENSWDATLCRPIAGSPVPGYADCVTGFYRYDPDPDIMSSTGISARFGGAATRRITYVLDTVRGG